MATVVLTYQPTRTSASNKMDQPINLTADSPVDLKLPSTAPHLNEKSKQSEMTNAVTNEPLNLTTSSSRDRQRSLEDKVEPMQQYTPADTEAAIHLLSLSRSAHLGSRSDDGNTMTRVALPYLPLSPPPSVDDEDRLAGGKHTSALVIADSDDGEDSETGSHLSPHWPKKEGVSQYPVATVFPSPRELSGLESASAVDHIKIEEQLGKIDPVTLSLISMSDGRRRERRRGGTGRCDKSSIAIIPAAQITDMASVPLLCSVQPVDRHCCSECGKHYATSSNLSRHKQTHRSIDSSSAKRCPVCDKAYVSMPALSMHILTHNLSHKCDICGKAFSRPWLLQGHMRSHSGDKPYSCAVCAKSFADRSNLRAHMQTHSGAKNFECARCHKTFALKSYLNKHCESTCTKMETVDEHTNSVKRMKLS